MLPVSGALQLNTSEAHTLRPICSLRKAYSRLLRRLQGTQARLGGGNPMLTGSCMLLELNIRQDGKGSLAYLHAWWHCVIGTPKAFAPRVQQNAHVTEQPLHEWLQSCAAEA